MGKLGRLFLLVSFFSTAVFCQKVSLNLASGSGAPGASISLNLTVSSQQAQAAGLQWTLTYWPQDIASIQILPGPVSLAAGKTVYCAPTTGASTCIVVGISNNAIADGVVAIIVVQLSPSATDAISAVRLANPVAAASDGSNIPVQANVSVLAIAQPAGLKAVGCTPQSVATPAAVTCSVVLTEAAPAGGANVILSSSTANVTLPASVTVPAGATSTGFNAATLRVSAITMAEIRAKMGAATLAGALILAPPGANVAIGDIVNAANYAGGPVAPGEIITVAGVGMGPAEGADIQIASGMVASKVAGVRLLFDGVAAPLLYVRADQINAIVPYGLAGNTSTKVQVEYQGVLSAGSTIPVAQTSPGVFSLDASGMGQGAILNQDGTVNSTANPAAPGSIVVIFGTGQGKMSPAAVDASIIGTSLLPKPVNPVSVTIGGANADVLYAGAAPELVAGVLQVNARIPKGIQTGPAVPLSLKMGTASMPPGITLAVQ